MKAVDQAGNAVAFLEDEAHQQPFDALIWGLRVRRDAAAREVEEWEELRTLASQIKQHTLANLAHYALDNVRAVQTILSHRCSGAAARVGGFVRRPGVAYETAQWESEPPVRIELTTARLPRRLHRVSTGSQSP